MSTTIREISRLLDHDGIKYQALEPAGDLLIIYKTSTYINREGNHRIKLILRIDDNGEFLSLSAPYLYQYRKSQHSNKLFKALLAIQYQAKFLKFEYDVMGDKEIKASIEIPIVDSVLTRAQLQRTVGCFLWQVEHWDPIIRNVLTTGHVDLCLESDQDKRFRTLLDGMTVPDAE